MAPRKSSQDDDEDVKARSFREFFLGTPTFRTVIVVLLFSMHPVGRQILGTFGFEFPDQRKLTVATEEAQSLKTQITTIATKVEDISDSVQSLKANNAILNDKVDRVDTRLTGFQVDFDKWKPKPTLEPK